MNNINELLMSRATDSNISTNDLLAIATFLKNKENEDDQRARQDEFESKLKDFRHDVYVNLMSPKTIHAKLPVRYHKVNALLNVIMIKAAEYDFSVFFRSNLTDETNFEKQVALSLVIRHKNGIEESFSGTNPIWHDITNSSNASVLNVPQRLAAACTHLRRQLIAMAFSLPITFEKELNEEDLSINAEQISKIKDLVGENNNGFIAWLQATYRIGSIPEIKQSNYKSILSTLKRRQKTKSETTDADDSIEHDLNKDVN